MSGPGFPSCHPLVSPDAGSMMLQPINCVNIRHGFPFKILAVDSLTNLVALHLHQSVSITVVLTQSVRVTSWQWHGLH